MIGTATISLTTLLNDGGDLLRAELPLIKRHAAPALRARIRRAGGRSFV